MESEFGSFMKTLRGWWALGRNVRVPNENEASWSELFWDDLNQLTRSDSAFESGSNSLWELRPLNAFTPKMLKTGPTPLVRQVVERPLKVVLNLFHS